MSWSISKKGTAGDLAGTISKLFLETQAPPEEEEIKNRLGDVAKALCRTVRKDAKVEIVANGSADKVYLEIKIR